jgi:translation elongation factor P/translation initiation factor 5A
MEATTQTKQARHLTTGETFQRFGRLYVVIENEGGTGGKGRSILATAQSGEKVILPFRRATEMVPVIA